MKVLVVSQYFWPETFRITEVVQSLREAGCEVTVLTGQPNYPEGVVQPGYRFYSCRTEIRDGLSIHRVPLIPRGRGSGWRLALNYLSFIVTAAICGPWLLRGTKVDVILVYAPSPILQTIPAVWLKWLKRAKLATWVQDLWPESLSATGFVRNRYLLGCVSAVVGWIYRHNDILLVQSQAFVAPVVKMAGGTPVVYHPNPGEIAFSAPLAGASPLKLDPGFNVVFAGNFGTVQALETLLGAAVLLREKRDVRLVLVGSGSRGEWVRNEVARLGLTNVSMPGRFPASDMPGILAQASAVVVSLVRDPIMSQTVPSKVQAYMASGRPILASLDGEGARVVDESGAGVACPAQDASALARAILRLRDATPAEREEMSNRGRLYYQQHFDPKLLASLLTQTLSETISEKLKPI